MFTFGCITIHTSQSSVSVTTTSGNTLYEFEV